MDGGPTAPCRAACPHAAAMPITARACNNRRTPAYTGRKGGMAMNPFDAKQAAEVWSRVTGTAEPQEQETLDLAELIRAELSDRDLYFALSQRVRKQAAPILRRIAHDEAAHAKKLAAVHFVRTGSRVSFQPQKPAGAPVLDLLREACREELAGAELYERAAQQNPELRELMLALAADERRHSRQILSILESLM